MERVLITICGRAGSKGFRNKNLKLFHGQPLSYYSLAAAELFMRQNPHIKADVCLNTDSDLLIETVLRAYPETVVLNRPPELCGDTVAKMCVFQHSLQQMQARGQTYDYLIDLDITSPLRRAFDVTGAYALAKEGLHYDVVFSVCPSRRTPYMNMARLVNGCAQRVLEHRFTARQQTPPVFDLNASIYVFRTEFLNMNQTGFLWDGVCGMYQMKDTGILDIDSEEDYLLMEVIAQHLYQTDPAFDEVRAAVRR